MAFSGTAIPCARMPSTPVLQTLDTIHTGLDDDDDDDVIWRPAPAGNAAGQDTYCSTSSPTHQNWAESIRLYFSGGMDGVIQGEMVDVVDVWVLCGASVVSNRCECTHMVLDSLLVGVTERDRLAAEDARWADNNCVGEDLSWHACR